MEKCQCPASGYSHFYEKVKKTGQYELSMCQCPASGYSHFYGMSDYTKKKSKFCVNALHRATAISTF